MIVRSRWGTVALAMPSIIPTASTDLDALLAALDAADTAVREIYRRLAGDPDLADGYDAGLHELRAKRAELARQAGMAALAQRRAARVVVETVEPISTVTTPPEPVPPATAPDMNGSAAATTTLPSEPSTPASEPAPTAAASPPAPPPGMGPQVEAPPSSPLPAPPSSAPIPPPPASDAQLAAWKSAVLSKGLGGTLKTAPAVQRPWGINLHELMCLLGPREEDLDDPVALADELEALDEVATPERQTQWVRFPIEIQKHRLAHLVARTRAMRDHPSSETVLDRLKRIRAVYPAWAREYVPGHINGLQLKHTPISETWANDGDEHWQALVAAVGHELPASRRTPPSRKKKERPVVEVQPTIVEPDWPLLPITRGKLALIVGGAPKEPNRERLEAYLRLATLEWALVDGPRKVEAVAQRIGKGAYDLVIVIQALISHPEAERILDAANASRTRWAMVDGYGAAAVRQGIERFVKPASKVG